MPTEFGAMFPAGMQQQRDRFAGALIQWIADPDSESLREHLRQLGDDHRKFNVEPRHYQIAGEALVTAWQMVAARHGRWQPEYEAAIRSSYNRLASLMIDGAQQHRAEQAAWGAEVTAHRRVLTDFAVITVRPDTPFAYRPGQLTTVELPDHPVCRRQWRQMSIASAPRPDNTFDLHVRAVRNGLVSTTLVAHSKVGDRLRLGPPRGNALVVEPGTVSGLLCIATGTGAAPIAAVVESVLKWKEIPNLYVYIGGRGLDDLYAVEHLSRLVAAEPHLNSLFRGQGSLPSIDVKGVVPTRSSSKSVLSGPIEEVPYIGPWATLNVDALVSGPSRMMHNTIRNLMDVGLVMPQIHWNEYDASAA
jgi:NAD(P)H-flavin reductase